MRILQETSLAAFHTFGIESQAYALIEAESVDDLLLIWRDKQYQTLPKLVLGKGSNLLFCDDFSGVVVLNRIKGITVNETQESYLLHVGAGEDWHGFVQWTIEHNMPGLENLALIPGCVGSSPIQNIGAYGVELQDICQYVDILDIDSGEVSRLSRKECQFGYRDSVFKHGLKETHIIVAVGFILKKEWEPKTTYGPLAELNKTTVAAIDIFNAVCRVRQSKLPDPQVLGNAGSFFKNPVVTQSIKDALLYQYPQMPNYKVSNHEYKLAAGWLIDQCDLKGKQIGGAKVHEQQALVLVNMGNATARDVLLLAQHVVNAVNDKFRVLLEHEVRFMGASKETTLSEVLA